MKRVYKITIITTIVAVIIGVFIQKEYNNNYSNNHIKIGFLYVGDYSNAYTDNFVKAMTTIESAFGDQVEIVPYYNISEDKIEEPLQRLIDEQCDLIFATSYGYENAVKEAAKKYPDIEFCMATADNANTEPKLDNYHSYMGRIYEGRYVSGIVAGMKLQEMINQGIITPEEAKIGYVGAFPYAEVISGFTAFYLGVASIVPEVTMEVKYADTWGDYVKEKAITNELIENGCVIISQHSDTYGPAIACEEARDKHVVYHVGYNKNMSDLAPTTSLISSKINWAPYEIEATRAVLTNKEIEDYVQGDINGNDACGGFSEGWVKVTRLNNTIAAEGTQEAIDSAVNQLKNRNIDVFKGNYIGVNPNDETDTFDLNNGYKENEKLSAPSFNYILKDVITILE